MIRTPLARVRHRTENRSLFAELGVLVPNLARYPAKPAITLAASPCPMEKPVSLADSVHRG
jgi:hypothetical protein